MTASLAASNSFTFSDGNAGHVINLGSAPAVGQWDILCVNSDTTVSTPSGFTSSTPEVGGEGAYMFRRLAVGGEAATVTITTAGNFDTEVGWTRWDNVNAADKANSVQASSSNTTSPSVTTGVMAETNELVIAFSANHNFPGSAPASPNWTTGAAGYTNALTMSIGAVGGFVGYSTTAGTPAEIPIVTWTNAAVDRYMLLLTFTSLAVTAQTIIPDGLTVPITLGAPTVSEPLTIVPTGISLTTTLGAPTLTEPFTVIPNGVALTATLGPPTLLDGSMTITPDGISVPITFGAPAVSGAANPLSGDLVQPIADLLLSCLCTEVQRADNPPANCCFRVGTEITQDVDLFHDLCCEGLGYVALGDIYPSVNSFPDQDIIRQANSRCGIVSWAVNFKVGIIRCSPVGGPNGEMPSCVDWTSAAQQNFVDAQVLRSVACCFLAALPNLPSMNGMSVVVNRQIQSNPQGGCIERYMTFDVQIPNCDC
jgi:hypothetical protein